MRLLSRTLGFVLLFVGLGIVCYSLIAAILELGGIYQNAIETPLDEPRTVSGAVGEKAVGDSMLRHVMAGAMGIVPLLAGSILLMVTRKRRVIIVRQR